MDAMNYLLCAQCNESFHLFIYGITMTIYMITVICPTSI